MTPVRPEPSHRRLLVLLAEGVLLALVHLLLLGSGGLFVGATTAGQFGAVLCYLGWFLMARALVEIMANFTRRAPVAGSVFVLTWSMIWLVLLGKRVVTDGIADHRGILFGAALVAGLMEIGWILHRRGARGRTGFAPAATVLVLGIAMAWVAPFVAGSPDSSEAGLLTDRLESLRPAASERFSAKTWNLLLITVDTLRADHLGTYGYSLDTSPSIDSLATAGMQLDNVVTVRPKTSPSFATILTGTYPSRHGIHAPAMVLRPEFVTLAERLKAMGFSTGASVTNGNLAPEFGFAQGFDSFEWGLTDASAVTDRGLAWLDSREDDSQPWHMWVHYTDPHTPYDPPSGYAERFMAEGSDSRSAREIAAYDGEIFYTDKEIGRLLSWLHARPSMLERTLILFTADHGESLGEHDYWFEHGMYPYEASSHVPLILVAPSVIVPGARSDALISNVDLVPTLLDALDAPTTDAADGRSFLPLLCGLSSEGPRSFAYIEAGYGEHIGPGRTRALRRDSAKTIERLVGWARWPRSPLDFLWAMDARLEGGLDGPERYDLVTDPAEATNVAAVDPALTESEISRLRAIARRTGTSGFTASALDPADIDPESLRSLKALGYIE